MKKQPIIIVALALLGISFAFINHSPSQKLPAAAVQTIVVPGLYPPPGYGVPNPNINQTNIQDNICNKNWSTKSIRPPVSYTTKLKESQLGFNASTTGTFYVLGLNKLSDYEEDHFWSLELGGSPIDPQNLWPQPYTLLVDGINLGAREKDKVEDYLHRQVCSGAMSLLDAQKAISTDWVKVYMQIRSHGSLGSSGNDISTSDDE